jgi:hypothetical protein
MGANLPKTRACVFNVDLSLVDRPSVLVLPLGSLIRALTHGFGALEHHTSRGSVIGRGSGYPNRRSLLNQLHRRRFQYRVSCARTRHGSRCRLLRE